MLSDGVLVLAAICIPDSIARSESTLAFARCIEPCGVDMSSTLLWSVQVGELVDVARLQS